MKPISIYVALTAIAAGVVLGVLDWGAALTIPTGHTGGFFTLLALGLLSEALSVRTSVGDGESNFSITFIPLLTGALLFGPESAVVLFLVVGAAAEFLIHDKPVQKATFNTAQYVVSSFAGGLVYSHVISRLADSSGPGATLLTDGLSTWSALAGVLSFGLTFLIANHAMVAGAIAISRGLPFRRTWSDLSGPSASNIVVDLLVSPVALAVALLYQELALIGLVIVLFPMLFVRHFYQINYRLSKANQDLLRALVKAIETRDPYTSGHSLRVSDLSAEIARAMGLGERTVARVEQSALLHDVGKIDAIYSEILKKPASLSSEERSIIESHVTKGVELLETLSSVPQTVILDVRHHHEREDGKGYPDGLFSRQIPIGAKIIKVSDAIDAMLSDRPYRKALDLETVRRELKTYAGTQFDLSVVKTILESDVLERHRESVLLHRLPPPEEHGSAKESSGANDPAVAVDPRLT